MHWVVKGIIGFSKMVLGMDRADALSTSGRDAICRDCPKLRNAFGVMRRCGVCGCIIAAKVRLASQKCSDDPPRWSAVAPLEHLRSTVKP